MLVGPGGNTTVQIGSEGPLVVDTQPAAMSARVLEAVRALSPRPIRHIVLTSGGDQQAGGAATISKAGRYVRVIDSIDPRGLDARASIIAHLNVLNRMSGGNSALGLLADRHLLHAGVVAVLERRGRAALSRPRRTRDGDTIVFFRRSDVISTGAIFDTTRISRGSIPSAAAASTASSRG